MKLLSKELLSDVLDIKIDRIGDVEVSDVTKTVTCWYKNKLSGIYASINIHELAYKCKEWALDNGYEIVVDSHNNRNTTRVYFEQLEVYMLHQDERHSPISVFIYCEWILEQKDTK